MEPKKTAVMVPVNKPTKQNETAQLWEQVCAVWEDFAQTLKEDTPEKALKRLHAENVALHKELNRTKEKLDALQAAIGLAPGETPAAPLPLAVYMRLQGKSEEEILRTLDHMQSNGKPWLFPAQIGVLFFLSEVWDGDTYRKKASDKLKEYGLPIRMKG